MRSWCVMLSASLLFLGCDDNSRKTKEGREAKEDRGLVPLEPSVGYAAFEIQGKDLDGIDFKLSEFKGKVVLLDFWGMWCPPCRKFLPHGSQLVKHYQGRPFAALGVNTDKEADVPKASAVAMRCWADGQRGPIASHWRIEGFPSIYVIDHEGIIRHKFVGLPNSSELDTAIERLVMKAEAAAAGKS
jgi:thiol-disulfide isomerase/thioredoxin